MQASTQALNLSQPQAVAANSSLNLRLPSPFQLKQQLPLSSALGGQVERHRQAVKAILDGEDDRLLVIVGPCSLHDPHAALEYAERLAALSRQVDDQLLLVMRAYVEKPRTTVGWKGLAYDPHLDGSDDMQGGLALSRQLMLGMLERGLPVATELLQPMAAGYFDDLLSWAAIGARTTESQIHREMVSGLGCRSDSRMAPTAAWVSPATPSAVPRMPTATSGWMPRGIRRSSRPLAILIPTWCCAAATRAPTTMPPAWSRHARACTRPASAHV